MEQLKKDEIKRIDIKEFREKGYLQELNRVFLHPLGMALEVIVNEDGSEQLGGIWDYRDDPEGIVYAENVLNTTDSDEKRRFVLKELSERFQYRKENIGYEIQPVLLKAYEEGKA
jgi:hypothetical protein